MTTSTSWYLLSVALPDVVVPTPPEGSAPTTPNQFSLRVNGHGIAAVQVIVDVGGGRIATFVTDAAGTAVLSAAGHITAVRPNDALLTLTP